jgi:N-acetylneuraminic acid mutarotase
MKVFLILLMCAQMSFAATTVFLVESNEHGKQVGMSTDGKTYKLHTTNKKLWHLYPDISEDGQWLTYVRGAGQKDLELIVENLKTKRIEKWGLAPSFKLHPRFGKNGKMLIYSTQVNGVNMIAIMHLEKLRKKLTAREVNGEYVYNVKPQYVFEKENAYFPVMFQSGDKIIYQRSTKNGREIMKYNLLTNEVEVMAKGMAPTLSKDEKFLAYTKKVDGKWEVYIFDLFKKTVIQLKSYISNNYSPLFDQYGNIFYTSDKLENGVFSIFKQSKDSWQNQKGIEQVVFSTPAVSLYAPRISGDEKIKTMLKADMTGEARSSFGAIYHHNRIYVVGGHQGAEHTYPPESFTARMTYYSFADSKWHNAAPRNYAAHGFQIAALGNYLYAFGGFAYEENNYPKWKSLDVVERYDIANNKWEVIGKMPRRRSSNVVVPMGTKIYIMGGWDSTPKNHGDIDGTFHDEIDVYDTITNKWTTLKTKLPLKRRAFSAFEKGGMIYLVGGISEGGSHFSLLDTFTKFNPLTETFSEMPKLPFGTFAPAAGVIGTRAYMFGGMFKMGAWEYDYVSHIYQYDFMSGMWTHTGRYVNENKGFSQVVKFRNQLGILGGHTYDGAKDAPVNTFEVFQH